MASDAIERLLNEIGNLLVEDADYPLAATLLHAEVDSNMVAPSIFKDLEDQILYRRDYAKLTYPLLDLWEESEPDKRWREMEYVLRDGQFTVTFTYPDEIDPEEDSLDRRDRIVRRHFGDKPIVYPPWPPDVGGFQFDL